MTGRLRTIFPDRGFGFIRTNAGDVFLHASALEGSPWEHLDLGDLLDFKVEDDPGRKRWACAIAG